MEMKWTSGGFQADLVVFSPAEAQLYLSSAFSFSVCCIITFLDCWCQVRNEELVLFFRCWLLLTYVIQSYFLFGVAGVFGHRHPTGEEADPSLQLFRGRWTDGVLRVGQRLGGKTVSDTSPGWTQPAVPPCRVLQSGKELAHLWVYIENFTNPSSLGSF